jgi:hypothetical protein
MVTPSRKPLRAHQLRPLNTPQPVHVSVKRSPATRAPALSVEIRISTLNAQRSTLHGRSLRVATIRDQWRVDDLWWRRPVSRRYFQAVLEDGRCVTVYQDLLTRRWFRQQA